MYFKSLGKPSKAFWFTAFVIYIAVLLRLTVLRDGILGGGYYRPDRVNLKLWDMYSRFLQSGSYIQFRYLLVGNFLCLAPLGAACPFFRKDSGVVFAAIVCGLTTLFIESSQLFFDIGYFELDDLVLNLLGGITGYAFFRCVEKLAAKIKRK